MAKTMFEQLGGTYTMQGDYCLPDLTLPPKKNVLSACGGNDGGGICNSTIKFSTITCSLPVVYAPTFPM